MSVNQLLGASATIELRRFVERGFVATAEVLAFTRVRGPGGVYEETWAVVEGQEAVPCGFKPAAPPAEVVAADALQAVNRFLVKMPHGTTITASNRLRITHTEPGIPSPLVMDVIGPYDRTGEIVRWVLCERVGGTDGA